MAEEELQEGEEEEQGEPQHEDGDEDEDEDEDEEDCNLSDDVASDDDAPIAARPRKLRRKRRKQPAASAVEEAELSGSEQPAKLQTQQKAACWSSREEEFGVRCLVGTQSCGARKDPGTAAQDHMGPC